MAGLSLPRFQLLSDPLGPWDCTGLPATSHQDCLEECFGGLVGSGPLLTRKEAK